MKLSISETKINSEKNIEIIDITEKVNNYVLKNNLQKGIITIASKHTTTALIINENEPRLLEDIRNHLAELVPDNKKYLHNIHDNNASSHIKSILLNSSQTVPIIDGKLNLGTWQRILFVELDGSRQSNCSLSLIGE